MMTAYLVKILKAVHTFIMFNATHYIYIKQLLFLFLFFLSNKIVICFSAIQIYYCNRAFISTVLFRVKFIELLSV